MNEAAFWTRRVKPLLHQPQLGRIAWKIPAETRKGLPDVWLQCGAGRGGWIELKYVPVLPKRAATPVPVNVTPAQLTHLRQAAETGALGFVLLGLADLWFLIHPGVLTGDAHPGFPLEGLKARAMIHGIWKPGSTQALVDFLERA